MSFLVQWFYILSLSLWVGSIVFFSFFTTPAIFSSLPKDMAGQVLTTLFPRYYLVGYATGGVLLFTTLLEALLVRQLPLIRIIIVAIMLASTLYAGMIVRPQVHNLKIEMKAVEEGTETGIRLKQRFDKLHGLSVILNLIVLVGGLFLIGILAFRLRA